jgi:ABC-2 type transport system ATP-binding protein
MAAQMPGARTTMPGAMPGGVPAVEAIGLAKRYGRRTLALDGIDLAVPQGSITALVGPNGSGKSTLMKAWVGFEEPTRGQVRVAGIDPWVDRGAALAQVGYIPQRSFLYRGLTVADHLDLTATFRPGFDRLHAEARLRQLRIGKERLVGELSGGEHAQVALALILGTNAPVLLLDEPLASLDPLARREFLHVLRESVRESGRTVVMSSHVVTDVAQACDRIVVLGAAHKLLDEWIDGALATHRIVVAAEVVGRPEGRPIGSFIDLDGRMLMLVRVDGASTPEGAPPEGAPPEGGPGRAATLEEIVLGYLAAGRPDREPVA